MKKLLRFKLIILIILINTTYQIFKNNINAKFLNLSPSTKSNGKFFKNYIWMINNNVIQYSSYVLRKKTNGSDYFSIRTSIILDDHRLSKETYKNSSFVCLLKSFKTGEIVKVPTTEVITLIHGRPKKVYCNLSNNQVIKIEDFLVAVIRIGDLKNRYKNLDY